MFEFGKKFVSNYERLKAGRVNKTIDSDQCRHKF